MYHDRMNGPETVGVIGATGYVGGRLVGWLTGADARVRVFGLDRERLMAREWAAEVELYDGVLSDAGRMRAFLEPVATLYFLVPRPDESEAARLFEQEVETVARSCREAQVRQVVILSEASVNPEGDVAQQFRHVGLPVIHFMCAPIIGSGSRLFEMIRSSVERSPMVILPLWADRPFHTISIRTVLQYLMHVRDLATARDLDLVIGSQIPTSMRDLFRAYARLRALKRPFVRFPWVRMHRLWLVLVTPVPRDVIRRTLRGIHDAMSIEPGSHPFFAIPDLSPLSAVRFALRRFATDSVATSWSDALPRLSNATPVKQRLSTRHEMITERVEAQTEATREQVFQVLCRIGGDYGWPYANALWRMRGWLDILFGGVGLRATRRSTGSLRVGDSVDFWRVEALETDRLLRFRAEMKLPGRAWLQFELTSLPHGGTHIAQTAFFDPQGVLGRLYWYAMYLPHLFIFPGLIRRIVLASTGVE